MCYGQVLLATLQLTNGKSLNWLKQCNIGSALKVEGGNWYNNYFNTIKRFLQQLCASYASIIIMEVIGTQKDAGWIV